MIDFFTASLSYSAIIFIALVWLVLITASIVVPLLLMIGSVIHLKERGYSVWLTCLPAFATLLFMYGILIELNMRFF